MTDLGTLPAFDPYDDDKTDLSALQLGDMSDISPDNAPGLPAAVNEAPPVEALPPPAPTHEDMQPHLPDTVPVMPAHGDLVRAYLESKLNLPQGPDPKLAQAQMEEKIDRAANSIGRAAGGLGTAITGGAAGFANQVAGKSYNTSGGMPNPVAEYDDKASPVQRYLMAKQAEQQASRSRLNDAKAELDMAKGLESGNPNGMAERKLELAEQEAKRRREQGDKGLDLRGEAGKQRDVALEQGGERTDETKRHNKETEALGWARLTEAQKKDVISAQKAGVSNDRLTFMIDKYNALNEGKSISGVQWNNAKAVPQKVATDIGAQLGQVDKLEKVVSDFKDAKGEAGYASLPLTAKRAMLVQLRTELLPLATATGGFGNFTVAHQHLAESIISDPAKALNMLNSGAFDTQLDGLIKSAREGIASKVKRAPGGGGRLTEPGEAEQPVQKYQRGKGFTSGSAAPTPGRPRRTQDGETREWDGTQWVPVMAQ